VAIEVRQPIGVSASIITDGYSETILLTSDSNLASYFPKLRQTEVENKAFGSDARTVGMNDLKSPHGRLSANHPLGDAALRKREGGDPESAELNRHVVGDARALQGKEVANPS
jgi:hypothetical protein